MDWSHYVADDELSIYETAGYGRRAGFGSRPAVLVVDVNYNFCGDRGLSLSDAVSQSANSCGPSAWVAVSHIATLLASVRSCGLPVLFSTGARVPSEALSRGAWAHKVHKRSQNAPTTDGLAIVDEIAPIGDDVVIAKTKPSMFFGTPLASYLTQLEVDSVIVAGVATSGCVRATVVDAFSHNYKVAVVEECVFDRGAASHAINLFDMDQKYADVVSLSQTISYVESLRGDN